MERNAKRRGGKRGGGCRRGGGINKGGTVIAITVEEACVAMLHEVVGKSNLFQM